MVSPFHSTHFSGVSANKRAELNIKCLLINQILQKSRGIKPLFMQMFDSLAFSRQTPGQRPLYETLYKVLGERCCCRETAG